ncbi:E3 ubiquitin protein ligase DRIP2-like isoform X3 [Populus nigra]|uniref:E3 ubiquitin protein ligase DRIP2-like isoform X3 n=1 Tax=Populus nigra TaxID=3691 RepID=UPI002B270B69|nr:E3 ubiquitin protein ligase DRIP2-like isoform X3 [Populus nigra]
MTMVPARSLSKQQQQQHQLGYGSYFGGGTSAYNESFGLMSRLEGYDSCVSEACLLGSDLVVANIPMAEDESRTNSVNNEAGSSSKDVQEERDEGWLQLSIGGQTTTTTTPTSHESKHYHHHHHHQQQQLVLDPTTRRGGLIELDLLPGPSSDFRVIDPPRRPHSGIWFLLQASQNQTKEPFLPQISKSYLRIKDGRMTVRLLMKYLVNKLGLDSESEQIEITCRGQQLVPFLTLQHVRDNIWSPRDALTLLPESSTTDHVMVLHYGRSA